MKIARVKRDYNWTPVDYVSPTGIKTQLHKVKTLADALGRTPKTVRAWEINGIIPPTPFRINNNRYYSDEHIQAVVEAAEHYRISNGRSISATGFTDRVYKKFKELNVYFFGESQ